MKTIVYYLPQFHRVPENDKWWGEGYTEWTAVRSAQPLYEGHYQPHVPLNHNYYDLTDKSTMLWQAALMREYGIDGVAIYHYYFKDGRKVLEKPAENLLKWRDIDMPYCFYWANESWARTWSKIKNKNSWNIKEEGQSKENNGILLEQDYGSERDWERHFYYLLPFFCDNRYIKIDGHPIFIIYKPEDMKELKKMRKVWDELSKSNGIKAPYYIGRGDRIEDCDAGLMHETFSPELVLDNRCVIDYSKHCESVIKRASTKSKNTYLCAHVGYDDTPRRGREGSVIDNPNTEAFYKQTKYLYHLSEQNGKDILFVNAWNEWGEGMHLEPDERFGYGFLETLKRAKEDYKELSSEEKDWLEKIKMKALTEQCERNRQVSIRRGAVMRVLDRWLSIRQDGGCIAGYFIEKGYNRIAIYGMGILGRHLMQELSDGEITVDYVIDKRGNGINVDISVPVYSPMEQLPDVDIIVVTPVQEFSEIYELLREMTNAKIESIEEILAYLHE